MIKASNITGPISRKAGGLFETVRHLCQSLQRLDMEIQVFGTADEFSAQDAASWDPVKVSYFHPFLHKQFGYSKEFYQELEVFHPDIIHTHGIWRYASVVTTKLHRKLGVPYMISPHGMLAPWAVRNSRWKKQIAHLLYEGEHLRNARCLRALCESEAAAIRAYGLKNPIAIIPNGIDLPDLSAPSANPANPVARLRAAGRKVLLYLGRINPQKGLPNLLRAWAALQKPEEWVLAVAGWDQGGHEDELKRLATSLGIPWTDARTSAVDGSSSHGNSLVFVGPQFDEDKEECYRGCDAFVLPSFGEGLPTVILEAWAYGKPALMTPECNLPEGFSNGVALRIETAQEGIQQGLKELFAQSDAERVAMGARGRDLVTQRFTWPTVATEMKRVYEWMLGGGGAPPESLRPS